MLISQLARLLDATVLCGDNLLEGEIKTACGSDLMSDVLAFDGGHNGALITGLVNPQVIRTAEMMDVKCIVFARGKTPTDDMVEMANDREIVLLSTGFGMLSACGILYNAGLKECGDANG